MRLPVLYLLCASICLFSAGPAYTADIWSPPQAPDVIHDKSYYPLPSSDSFTQKGRASWYGPAFHGRRTSSGEIYNMHSMTAAHKTLPMDTVLLVENLENGRKTLVRVNDRGPLVGGRIIDLSFKAAKALGVVGNGTAKVKIATLDEGEEKQERQTPTLADKTAAVGEFYVQIGSFAKKINALKVQKQLTDAGHTTVINKTFDPKDVFFRVHVYVGKTLQNAKIAEKSFLKRGYTGAFVVAR